MQTRPVRLSPGQDLRATLDAQLRAQGARAGFVLTGIGSLSVARLRFAGAAGPTELRGEFEIVTLAGSLSLDGPHLHMALSDADGRMLGGHVADGCIVRTTVEALLVLLPGWSFSRVHDDSSGYKELLVRADHG
jgi:predicted DNA-binding protein with PD1-like motif